MSNRKLNVFLCHSSQDKFIVRDLYKKLLAEGWINPWLDEEKLLPGQDWEIEIEKAVEIADAVIVCLSNNSVSKEGYVQRELRFALDIALEKPEGAIFIIPLRLDNCEPPRRLRAWQYTDYFPESNRNVSFARILASLKKRALSLSINLQTESEPIHYNPSTEILQRTLASFNQSPQYTSIQNSTTQDRKIVDYELTISNTFYDDILVTKNGALTVMGICTKNIFIESGAIALIYGTVSGNIYNYGGDVNIYGIVVGFVQTKSGKTHIDPRASVGAVRQ